MKKKKSYYVCNECGYVSVKWYGKCPQCNTWDSMVLRKEETQSIDVSNIKKYNINDIKIKELDRIKLKKQDLNRLFGKGIVKGEIILLAGAPGVGKSTFAFYLIDQMENMKILYISGEESQIQIKMRAERLKVKNNFDIVISNNIEEIISIIDDYDFIILDSIQTINSSLLQGVSGSPTMVKYILGRITEVIKSKNIPILIIGHITKDGTIAGPKTLEHMVDSVFFIENLKDKNIKLIKSVKNRFGSTDEMILMKMEEKGLKLIKNIDVYSISDKSGIGRVISCTINGSMPLAIEIQSLVSYSKYPVPQRVGTGIQYKRMQMLLGITDKYLKLNIGNKDVFINVSSGLNINDSMCDLAFIAAIYSSANNIDFGNKIAFLGELTLSGNIIGKENIELRIKHLEQLGIEKIVIPFSIENKKYNSKIIKIQNIKDLNNL